MLGIYKVWKCNYKTKKEILVLVTDDYKEVENVTKGYRYNGTFYERRGSNHIYIVC